MKNSPRLKILASYLVWNMFDEIEEKFVVALYSSCTSQFVTVNATIFLWKLDNLPPSRAALSVSACEMCIRP